jgi:hypothetical protein
VLLEPPPARLRGARGLEGYPEYPGALPGGLAFGDLRKSVRRKLGKPSGSGGGAPASGAASAEWDRIDREGHSVRVQYDKAGAAEQVTLFRSSPEKYG